MGDEHSLVVNMLLVASTGRMGSKVADLASVGECQHRLARDFERYATTVAAFIRLAMIRIMLRRLTRPTLCQ
jgi:hypothetical protein